MKPRQWVMWVLLFLIPTIVTVVVGLIAGMYIGAPLDSDFANTFLASLAQILAGILAIVFSVSVLAVGIVSDRYTSQFIRYITESKSASFVLFFYLLCIALFVIGMGIQNIPMVQGGFLATIWLFTFSLMLVPIFFESTLQRLDPGNLALSIQKEALQALKQQNGTLLVSRTTSLGDLARKAFERGEDDIVERCLHSLAMLQQAVFTQDSKLDFLRKSMAGRDLVLASWEFGLRSPVVGQYYRIYELAIKSGNEGVASHIVQLLSDAVTTLSQRDGTTESLKGILLQYQEFIEVAIEHKSLSRIPLVWALGSAMLPKKLSLAFAKNYLPLYGSVLVNANRIIVDRGDMELWKRELGYFSSVSSIENAHATFRNELHVLLSEIRRAEVPIKGEKLALLHSITLQNSLSNWHQTDLALLIMNELRRAISGLPERQQLLDRVQNASDLHLKWWAITRVYDVFFASCVYALYQRQIHYIKELWQHVNPPDASGLSLNTNLVYFNAGFLTYQMVAQLSLPRDIDDFHGAELYDLKYYLLCLAYALKHSHTEEWLPQTQFFVGHMLEQSEPFPTLLSRYISAVHTFLLNWP